VRYGECDGEDDGEGRYDGDGGSGCANVHLSVMWAVRVNVGVRARVIGRRM
jgi:hypothetical protein